MSKTRLNNISPESLASDFGVDVLRYYLLRDLPLGPDGDFSYEGMLARYNSDLANNLGNLVSRVATLVDVKCAGVGPKAGDIDSLRALAAEIVKAADEQWAAFSPARALAVTWRLIRGANAYLEETEPWRLLPGDEVDQILGAALEALRIVTILVSPAMPDTARTIWGRIGLPGRPEETTVPAGLEWGGYPGGLSVTRGSALFPRRRE
jgi:methionyl-tRNA synthetase